MESQSKCIGVKLPQLIVVYLDAKIDDKKNPEKSTKENEGKPENEKKKTNNYVVDLERYRDT